MQTLSVRIPDDDLTWLLSLDIAGARNPSDRIRSLVAANRRQHQGMTDYVACVAMLRDFVAPFQHAISVAERRHAMHSEVVAAIADGLPELMAETIAMPPLPDDDRAPAALAQIEASLAASAMRLFIRLLRLCITQATPAYNPDAIEAHLGEVIELAQIIAARRNLSKE